MTTMTELLDGRTETGETEATPAADDIQAQDSQDSQETSQTSPQQEKTVPLKALEAEREKRQNHERALEQQQRQIAMLIETLRSNQPIPPAQQVPNPPDFLTENDAWQKYLFSAIGQMLDHRDSQEWTARVEAAEEDMRESTKDYDELVDKYFKPVAARDPELQAKLRRAPNPAKYAYRTAKRMKTESELGGNLDIDSLKSKIEAEVRAKLMAELKGKQSELQAELKDAVKLPESLGSGSSAPPLSESVPRNGYRARDLYG